jgi:hypothetical protein
MSSGFSEDRLKKENLEKFVRHNIFGLLNISDE